MDTSGKTVARLHEHPSPDTLDSALSPSTLLEKLAWIAAFAAPWFLAALRLSCNTYRIRAMIRARDEHEDRAFTAHSPLLPSTPQ
jgi:hypothetical protein